MADHEHDRFLYEREGFLHFGCVNPFCGHGNPALPRHYKIPLETKELSIKLLSHKDRKVELGLTRKDNGDQIVLTAGDSLEECKEAFDQLFNSREANHGS